MLRIWLLRYYLTRFCLSFKIMIHYFNSFLVNFLLLSLDSTMYRTQNYRIILKRPLYCWKYLLKRFKKHSIRPFVGISLLQNREKEFQQLVVFSKFAVLKRI